MAIGYQGRDSVMESVAINSPLTDSRLTNSLSAKSKTISLKAYYTK